MTRAAIPDSQYFRHWKKSTDRLREHLQRQLDSIAARAQAKRDQADEIEKEGAGLQSAIALIDEWLPRRKAVQLAAEPAETALPGSGRWSSIFDKCTRCGTTERKHAARGLCTQCYWAETHPESPVGARLAAERVEAMAEAKP